MVAFLSFCSHNVLFQLVLQMLLHFLLFTLLHVALLLTIHFNN